MGMRTKSKRKLLTVEERAFAAVLPKDWPIEIAKALAIIGGEAVARATFDGTGWPVEMRRDVAADVDDALYALVGDTCREPQPIPAAA